MSDVFRHRKEFHRPRFYPVVADDAIEVGDLMYWDATEEAARPVSAFTYGTTLGETQKAINHLFLGMSGDRSKAGDTIDVEVQASGIKEYVCASTTWEVGDLVGIDDNSGGTALEDQQVIAVTNTDKAIGIVAKRVSSAATAVQIELFPNILETPKNNIIVWEHIITAGEDTAGYIDFDSGWGADVGAVIVQVRNGSTDRNEDHDFDITKLATTDIGKVRIADGYSTALDTDDVLTVIVYRYANSQEKINGKIQANSGVSRDQ